MIKIRIANQKDAEIISKLGKTTFTQAFGNLFNDKQDLTNYLNITFALNKIKKSLQNKNNIYWLATSDNLPIAYAKMKINSSNEFVNDKSSSQLQKIYVLAEFTSMKVGKTLLKEVLLKANNIETNCLWLSVWDGNKKAIKFYERNGFKSLGMHTFQIGNETFEFLNMSKRLKIQ